MGSKHTSGPWQQYHDEYEPLRIIGNVDGDERGMLYESIVEEVEGKTRDEALANARLIAAAPELLSQLQFAVKLLGAFPALGGSAQVASMRETIAKATATDRRDALKRMVALDEEMGLPDCTAEQAIAKAERV